MDTSTIIRIIVWTAASSLGGMCLVLAVRGWVSCGSWLPQHTSLLVGFGDRGQKAVKPTFPLMEHTKHLGRGENHEGHTCHVLGTLPDARL